MGRSHAWVPPGPERIGPRPWSRADNLTLLDAIRIDQPVSLRANLGAITTGRFVTWVRWHIARYLRRGDVVLMDNLANHKAR